MYVIANEKLSAISGGVFGGDMFLAHEYHISNDGIALKMSTSLTGSSSSSSSSATNQAIAEVGCHIISGALGFSVAVLLAEAPPLAILGAEYAVSKIDGACTDYVKGQK